MTLCTSRTYTTRSVPADFVARPTRCCSLLTPRWRWALALRWNAIQPGHAEQRAVGPRWPEEHNTHNHTKHHITLSPLILASLPRSRHLPRITHHPRGATSHFIMLVFLYTGLSLVDPSPAAAAQLLGVKLGSLDRATVRLAYRQAAARSHPDVSESADAGAHFVDVTAAAQVLREHLDQSRSAASAAHSAATAAAARRARWSESEQESVTAAAARARWTEYWKAALSLPPLESTLGQRRVQLGELLQRHEHTCQVSKQHAGVAQAWPDSALASALATLLQQAHTHARTRTHARTYTHAHRRTHRHTRTRTHKCTHCTCATHMPRARQSYGRRHVDAMPTALGPRLQEAELAAIIAERRVDTRELEQQRERLLVRRT